MVGLSSFLYRCAIGLAAIKKEIYKPPKTDNRYTRRSKFVSEHNKKTNCFRVRTHHKVRVADADVTKAKSVTLRICTSDCRECLERWPIAAPCHWFFTSQDRAEKARDEYLGVVAALRNPLGHQPFPKDKLVKHAGSCKLGSSCTCTHTS